jgi:hypothetical protein
VAGAAAVIRQYLIDGFYPSVGGWPLANTILYLPNIADSEVLNEASQTVLKIDFVCL